MEGLAVASTMLGIFSILTIAYYVFYVIGYWKAFEKAGEPGWKTLIPVYNQYTMFKLAWKPSAFWIYFALQVAGAFCQSYMENNPDLSWLSILASALSLAVAVYFVLFNIKTAKAYGKGVGFGIGLTLLPYVFMLILGFGSSVYIGNPDAKPASEEGF